jgi:ABC-type polar amino acid transport system ATPase subunit
LVAGGGVKGGTAMSEAIQQSTHPASAATQRADGVTIVVENVAKRFGERRVLNGVSLTVPAGQTVALIGPSGGGKSTLLRCLNGLASFDSGSIRVGPHTLPAGNGRPSPELQQVRLLLGMVFQDFQLFPHRTALGNVMEAPVQVLGLDRRTARERALRLLRRVGLESHADAWPAQLSGGQKQRVAIARALAMEPRGLLCDEITSALDPELKHEVLDVLEDLKRDGLTLVLVTHEIGFARRSADRVVFLADGRVLEEGPPEQVLDKPREPRTQQFLRRVLI